GRVVFSLQDLINSPQSSESLAILQETEDLHRDYGFEITSLPPDVVTPVSKRFTIKGKYKVKPPDNITVRVLEFIPNSHQYWFKRILTFHEREYEWESLVSIGGTVGEERI